MAILITGKTRKTMTHNKKKTAAALMTGTALGITAGVLLAPKSGKDTRTQIKEKAKGSWNKGKEKATHAKDTAKDQANQLSDATKQTIEEGKQAAKENKRAG